MSIASRLPAVILLCFVLVGAALLIAGYGPAVGVGLIVGVALGLAVVVAFLASNRGGRSGSWVSGLSQSSSGPDHELIMRHGREWTRVAGVDAGALQRVLAVGSSATAAGVRVELIALEIRDDGLVATLAAHTRPPAGTLGHFALASVADDAGTRYVTAAQGGSSSSPETSRVDLRAAPAPPASARVLTLRIEQFDDPFGGGAAGIVGPWEFSVEL